MSDPTSDRVPSPVTFDPADRITMSNSLGLATVAAISSLTAPERAAFILRVVFGISATEASRLLGRRRSEVNLLAAIARRRLTARRPPRDLGMQAQHQVVAQLTQDLRRRDFDAVARAMHPQVLTRTDSVGRVKVTPSAAIGVEPAVEALRSLTPTPPGVSLAVHAVNGWPGIVTFRGAVLTAVVGFAVGGDADVVEIDVLRDPGTLRAVAPELSE